MFDKSVLLFLYTETPLHTGSGTSLGIVDLPIQRERTTGYPIVQSSGLKGCLREEADQHPTGCQNSQCAFHPHKDWADRVKIVFGPDTQRASEHAGALSVGDARILLFPVRSLVGVFAWVTSKNVLALFKRDAERAGIKIPWEPVGPDRADQAFIGPNSMVRINDKVVLEEFAFTAGQDDKVQAIANWIKDKALPLVQEYAYWKGTLEKRLVILPEDAFRDFVQYATEVIARIRLDDKTKTVERGALWTEEHLPSETLLYATLFASNPRVSDPSGALQSASEVLQFVKVCVDGHRFQLGGDSTVGRGVVMARVVDGAQPTVPGSTPPGGQP